MRRRSWLAVPLLAIVGCQTLWGDYKDPNPKYCDVPTLACPAGQYCDVSLHSCMMQSASGDMAATNPYVPPVSSDLVGVGKGLIAGAVADFDGDSLIDLAILSGDAAAAYVTILYGNGAGGFSPQGPSYTVDAQVNSIAVGELGGNNLPDLVIPTGGSGAFTVFINPGTRSMFTTTFQSGYAYSGGVAVGDLNGDGRADVVMAKELPRLKVHLGMVGGMFGSMAYPPAQDSNMMPCLASVIADFDRDGQPDVATLSVGVNTGVTVWTNKGGSFNSAPAGGSKLPMAAAPRALATRDLNGDGNADLVVASRDSDDVNILLGQGDGTFRAPAGGGQVAVGANSGPRAVVVADLSPDHGSALDLAVGNELSRDVRLFAGRGDGTFDAAVTVLGPVGSIAALLAADVNRDGKQDLIVLQADAARYYVLRSR